METGRSRVRTLQMPRSPHVLFDPYSLLSSSPNQGAEHLLQEEVVLVIADIVSPVYPAAGHSQKADLFKHPSPLIRSKACLRCTSLILHYVAFVRGLRRRFILGSGTFGFGIGMAELSRALKGVGERRTVFGPMLTNITHQTYVGVSFLLCQSLATG